MSTVKQVILSSTDQDVGSTIDWSYFEWPENEVITTRVADVETQTDWAPAVSKETQTSSPVIMHIDLSRTHSKLKHASLVDADSLVAPLFQFDRQAPGRISTSPTLRRMRSTRRPQMDIRDSVKMESTQEEPGTSFPMSPLSPLHRHKSPLATESFSEGEVHNNGSSSSSCLRRPRSRRSNTFDNGIGCIRQDSPSTHQRVCKEFEFSDGESQEAERHHDRLQERRRSSVVVSLPGLDVSPGDLFVSNGAVNMLSCSLDTKKPKWPFLRRSTTKTKTPNHTDIEKYLSASQIQDWRNSDLQKYKDCSVVEFLGDRSSHLNPGSDPKHYKRQEAIWELFSSECVYFLDQIMVLKEVFLTTLSNLQTRNCLCDVESWRLFANLGELCMVSFAFLNNLLRVIKGTLDSPAEDGGPPLLELLSKAFGDSICQCLQKYCLNYSTALVYLDSLKHRQDFGSYVKWCERNEQCRRLQLRDLLVAPLQRLTRYPLLLRNIRKRCWTEEEEAALQVLAEHVDTSICDLEGKVKWLDNYQKVKQLRDALVWLPVWERDKRAFIPEKVWMSKIEGAMTALLKLDSQQPRVKSASLWLESSQI
ncbi:pleckstrin homology domain-containing family G member 7 isoform X2 [Lampris incognitus]|uniref:pleckstrin homology domain-containing family G member 7 isoform X2 n=1 Tax=Lampris incognitus TaxID=2546036 RepID=UPI0024B52BD0|nr:pleckstrin homology domain-containing family G member 7 isoform X2 [Lampris incognitus]